MLFDNHNRKLGIIKLSYNNDIVSQIYMKYNANLTNKNNEIKVVDSVKQSFEMCVVSNGMP